MSPILFLSDIRCLEVESSDELTTRTFLQYCKFSEEARQNIICDWIHAFDNKEDAEKKQFEEMKKKNTINFNRKEFKKRKEKQNLAEFGNQPT